MSFDSYRLEDEFIWDFWYARQGGKVLAFYLQYPRAGDPEYIHSRQSVGHAVSKDLLHWEERPAALQALTRSSLFSEDIVSFTERTVP
ncbi:hypothetical protein [Cohnella silvisoli]|uniref:Glycosyl hydrolase family 32 N-terminal domain-containing protein n=1 Tax=Cohnella silvisoli TaxID=2873699 RepID=A0ABV1KMQ2_9BACL|nr:hypothetical protein [Cohnella silvisoli]MCD9020308.1 hypothetical protein [Cohnella silvisoli]